MNIQTFLYTQKNGWRPQLIENKNTQYVLVFGCQKKLFDREEYNSIAQSFPSAQIVGSSSAGEIHGQDVHDFSITVMAIEFATTQVTLAYTPTTTRAESFSAGNNIAKQLKDIPKLKHEIVFADGVLTSGDELTRGIKETMPSHITVAGGMACDYNLVDTNVWYNDSGPESQVVAIGLSDDDIISHYSSFDGFSSFGPKRKLTKVKDNILYEFDDKPELELYKKYLGEEAENLPDSGLKFPLAIASSFEEDYTIIRGVQNVDEENNALVLSGNVQEGTYGSLMHAHIDDLNEAGAYAAIQAMKDMQPELAIIVSCIGRKILMDHRTADEIEDACEALPKTCTVTGFYSFGELCPGQVDNATCLI